MIQNQLKGFRTFILRGNVVDLAVGVAIGAAFTAVVQSLVTDLITPLITAAVAVLSHGHGTKRFETQTLVVHGHTLFAYGHLINIIVSFLLTAAVIFFLVVEPVNRLTELANRRKRTDDPSTKKCTECLSVISRDARRCKYCTSRQTDVKSAAAAK